MSSTRIFLEQIDQSGASSNYVISWNGTVWSPAVVTVPDGTKGDISISGGVWSIVAASVSLAKMANLAANSIIGNNTGSPATPLALTSTQVTAMLNPYVGATSGAAGTKGLVPAGAAGDQNKVLKGDATWLTLATVATTGSASDITTGTLPVAQTPAQTGDVTKPAGSSTTTIATNAVTLAKIATQATGTILGNNSGSTASPLALTGTQVTAMLDAATTTTQGLLTTTDYKKLQAVKQDYFQRTITTAIGDAISVCSVTSTYAITEIGINAGANNTKFYYILHKNNATAGVWQRAVPYFTSGSSTDDYDLDVSISGTTATYRVRRTAGSTSFTASMSVRLIGDISATITGVVASQSAQTVSTFYNAAVGSYSTQGRSAFMETAASSQKTIEVHNAATSNDTFMYLGMGYAGANDEEGIIGVRKLSTDYIVARATTSGLALPLPALLSTDVAVSGIANSNAHFIPYLTGGNARVQSVGDLILNTNAGTNALTLKTTGAAEFGSTARLKSFTAAGAPSAATAGVGSLYYQSDATAGAYLSDGSAYSRLLIPTDIAGKANLSGGNTFSGVQNFSGNISSSADIAASTIHTTGSGSTASVFYQLAGTATSIAEVRAYWATGGTGVVDLQNYSDTFTFFSRAAAQFAQLTSSGLSVTGTIAASNFSGSHTGSSSGTNTGDQTITLTGDVTGTGTGSFATTIGANKVTLGQMAQVATGSFLGRTTAATGNVEALTATQATALLNTFTTTVKGLVPAPVTATGRFLKDDATWSTVSTGVSTFQALTDATDYVAGDANKPVVVNSAGTGITYGTSALGTAAYSATTAFAAAVHTHVISDVTGLQSALNAKLDTSATTAFTRSFLSAVDAPTAQSTLGLGTAATADSSAFAAAVHTHAMSDIIGLTAALSGKEPTITSGTTAQYWRGDKTWATLDKTAVGLANVDNTSDVNKPVSSATSTALALKAPIANPTFTGTVTLAADPMLPLQAATKQYVDGVAQGLDVKGSVIVATTGNITLSGEQTIDGVLTSSSRVLVKNQSTQSQNGIYVSSSGAWTRALDMDAWVEVPGAFVFVETGTLGQDTGWVCTSNAGGTINTTAINWSQFSGAGTYTSSGGITLNLSDFRLTDMADSTIKGRAFGAGSGAPTDLTGAQVNSILPVFTTMAKGLVPSPGSTSGRYLKDDGTWSIAGGTSWNGVVTAVGTGTSQAVTLPESGLAPQDVLVFVDGIRWNIAEYSIVGTSLTLTTNIAGESIQIVKPTGAGGSNVYVPVVLSQNITGAAVVDCNGVDVLRLTLTGNVTSLTLNNLVDGKKLHVEFIQDATGARTISLSAQFKFGTDIPSYTPTSTAGKTDIVGLNVSGTNVYVTSIVKGY